MNYIDWKLNKGGSQRDEIGFKTDLKIGLGEKKVEMSEKFSHTEGIGGGRDNNGDGGI